MPPLLLIIIIELYMSNIVCPSFAQKRCEVDIDFFLSGKSYKKLVNIDPKCNYARKVVGKVLYI